MKKLAGFLWDTTIYKIVVICVFILTPSYFLCAFPQPFSAALLLWGAAILIRDLLIKRDFLKQTGSLLLILFCVGYAISILLYAENELVSTIHLYCWTIVEFLVLFAVDSRKKSSPQFLLRELYKVNAVVSVVTLLTGALSLACFLLRASAILPDLEGVNGVWFLGVVNGRNSGIFNNPISCANAMFVGCAAALFNLVYPKGKKWYAAVGYIAAFLVCLLSLITTLTRTYVYGIYILVFISAFIAAFQWFLRKNGKVLVRYVATVCIAAAVTGLLIGGAEAGKLLISKAATRIPALDMQFLVDMYDNSQKPEPTEPTETEPTETEPTETEPSETEPSETKPTEPEDEKEDQKNPSVIIGGYVNTTLNRDEIDRLPNFFYPRNELWKVALQVIPHSPVFGFTAGNRQSSSLAYGSTPYFYQYEKVGIITYHNAYFDVAVSAGLLGLGLMLLFLGLQIVRTLRTVFSRRLLELRNREIWGLSVGVGYLAVHVVITCMFLGVLCLTNASVCIYFWLLLGYVSKINDHFLGGKTVFSGQKNNN